MIFADVVNGDPVNLALVAIVGTVITGLFKLLNDNTKALYKLVHSSEKVAEATQRAAREAKQRNGHLGDQTIKIGEQNVQIVKLLQTQNKDVSTIATTLSKSALIAAEDRDILTASTQHVDNQTVEHQTVKGK